MYRRLLKSKIHRSRSTDSTLDYAADLPGRNPISVQVYENNQVKDILC